jgi:hypothetical protein
MRYVSEVDLKEQFWKMYSKGKTNILAYQFESKEASSGRMG